MELVGTADTGRARADLTDILTAVDRWATEFCLPSEHLSAEIYRADVNLRRSFDVDSSPAEARASATNFLNAWLFARAQYVDNLQRISPLVDDTGSEEVLAFHRALETLLETTGAHFDAALADIAQLDTTAAIAARIYELSITLWTDPAALTLSEAYDSLPLEVLVALGDEGRCGGFAPQTFFTEPSV